MLRRIQELTTDGVSLAGVRKILELEADLADARDRIAALEAELDGQRQAQRDEIELVHRQYRRTLVPVSKAVVRARR